MFNTLLLLLTHDIYNLVPTIYNRIVSTLPQPNKFDDSVETSHSHQIPTISTIYPQQSKAANVQSLRGKSRCHNDVDDDDDDDDGQRQGAGDTIDRERVGQEVGCCG